MMMKPETFKILDCRLGWHQHLVGVAGMHASPAQELAALPRARPALRRDAEVEPRDESQHQPAFELCVE